MFTIEDRDRVRSTLLARALRLGYPTAEAATDEIERSDPALATTLRPMLADARR